MAASAARERWLRESVLNSTRTQPNRSKACSSINSFASVLAPVPHADGVNHVQPISSARSSGRNDRNLVLPIGRSLAASVAKGTSLPSVAAARACANHSWKRSGVSAT